MFLIKLAALITQTERQVVKPGVNFEWSSFWTHNVFRLLETIFGRKVGLRLEMTSWSDGETQRQVAHTFEASVALVETFIRENAKLPRFELVRAPVLAMTNGMQIPTTLTGYMLAIAYDAGSASDGGTNTASPSSTTHTCTGSNLALAIGIWNRNNSSGFTPSGVTYNSVSAGTSKVTTANTATGTTNVFLYGLASPATGANSVAYTYGSSSVRNGNVNASFSGAAASPFGAVGSGETQTTTVSYSVSTAAANSMIASICATDFNVAASATGTNQTYRTGVVEAGGFTTDISTQTTTSTGSYTSSWSRASAAEMTSVSLEIEALASATVSQFAALGVG